MTRDKVLSTLAKRSKLNNELDDWSTWLAGGEDPKELTLVRRNIEKGLPCGSDQFIKKLEKCIGRSLRLQPQGRPKLEE